MFTSLRGPGPRRIVLAIAASSFAACGDDDKPASDTAVETTAEVTETTPEAEVLDPAAAIERGRYLVENVAGCPDCHTSRVAGGAFDTTKKLAGIDCFVDIDPGNADFGCIATANLTNHATGLMNRTDDQIKAMFMTGVRPDGRFLHSLMPYWVFGNMADADADAIVAYLRSTTGVDHTVAASQGPWAPVAAAAPVVDLDTIPMPRADYPEQEAAMRGRYLAANVGPCLDCHTQSPAPGTSAEPRIWAKAFQGGEAFNRDAFGLPPFLPENVYSANLTPHASGLSGWTVADVKKAIKEGVSKDGTLVCPPMPAGPMGAFGGMSDADAEDIAHFIVSLEAKENVLPNGCGIPAEQ